MNLGMIGILLLAIQDYDEAWKQADELLLKRDYVAAIEKLQPIEKARADAADLIRVREMLDKYKDEADILKAYKKDAFYDPYIEFLFQLFEQMPSAAKGFKDLRPAYKARVEAIKKREKDAADLLKRADQALSLKKVRQARKLYLELEAKFARAEAWTKNQAAIKKKLETSEAEVVLYASEIETVKGWELLKMEKSAAGQALRGMTGDSYFEVEFLAAANAKYRLWLHMGYRTIESNRVGVVFVDEAARPDGSALPKAGEEPVNVQWYPHGQHPADEGGECWGWTDSDTVHGGKEVIFQYKTAGMKKIRVVVLESGTPVDQIVISSAKFLDKPPDKALAPKD